MKRRAICDMDIDDHRLQRQKEAMEITLQTSALGTISAELAREIANRPTHGIVTYSECPLVLDAANVDTHVCTAS
jgi:hypothetical protein